MNSPADFGGSGVGSAFAQPGQNLPDGLVPVVPLVAAHGESRHIRLFPLVGDGEQILAWEDEVNAAVETAKNELGVTFIEDVDKAAFQAATASMVDDYCVQYPEVQQVVDIIEANK